MNKLQKDILELETQFKTKSCRICLTPDIHNNCNLINKKLIECIKFCTGIRINQNNRLPTQICKDCLSSIAVAYKFKKLCMDAEEICKTLLENRTKVDMPEVCAKRTKVDMPEIQRNLKQNVTESYTFAIKKVEVDHNESQVNDTDIRDDGGIKENFVSIDHLNESEVEKIVMDNSLNADGNDVTYLIYDPGAQDDGDNLMEDQGSYGDVDNSLIDMSGSSSIQRESDESYTKLPKKLMFGPYSKSKLQRIKLYCKWCDLKFATKQEAGVHREMVHKRRTSFTCKVCGKTFTHRAAHYLHRRSHLPPMFACDHCDYRTSLKFQMAIHVRIHADGPKRYQCEQCPSAYHTSSNLLNHRRKVHERLKRFACHVCGKTFFTNTDLNDHVDTHSKVKRFQCDICQTLFSVRWSWKSHLLKQHGVVLPPARRGQRKINVVVGDTPDASDHNPDHTE